MPIKNTAGRWGAVSQTLHWLVVLLLLVIAVVGLTMGDLPRTPRWFWVYTLHKSLGISVLVLMLLRLGWRLYAGAPRPVAGTPGWQAWLAGATHGLLYAVALALPLSGWLYDSANSLRPFRLFGQLTMPKLSGPNAWLADQARSAHELLFWALVVLVVAHVGAALYHHLFQDDDTLRRMLPGRRRHPQEDPDHAA